MSTMRPLVLRQGKSHRGRTTERDGRAEFSSNGALEKRTAPVLAGLV